MKRMPISLTKEEHQLLKDESERTGLSCAKIIRLLLAQMQIRTFTHGGRFIKIGLRKLNKTEWRELIKKKDNYKCAKCGIQGTQKTCTAHHIIPIKQGGLDTLDNGLTYCKPCHRKLHESLKAKEFTLQERQAQIKASLKKRYEKRVHNA